MIMQFNVRCLCCPQTCTAQGFFGQFVLSTVGYNTSLAVYYFLFIHKGWKEDHVRRVEIWLHLFSNTFWLITGVAGIILEIFNAALFNCWVAPSPYDCHQTGEPCVRGSVANYFQWAFYYVPIFVMIVVVTYLMFVVYMGVRRIEKKVDKDVFEREKYQEKKRRERSKQVATQGMWYLAPFYLTRIFPVLYQLVATIGKRHVPALAILTGFFIPFQGALNFIVYIRPRYLRYRKKKQNKNLPAGSTSEFPAGSNRFLSLFIEEQERGPSRDTLEDNGTDGTVDAIHGKSEELLSGIEEDDCVSEDDCGNAEEVKIEEEEDCVTEDCGNEDEERIETSNPQIQST
jgi:membrane protein implicated in regulation of membrane protease activity